MKRVLLLAVILLALAGSLTAQEPSDLERDGLRGKVKSATVTFYKAEELFGEWYLGDIFEIDEYEYNLKGDYTSVHMRMFHSQKSTLDVTLHYQYDENYNLPKEVGVYDQAGTLKEKILTTYSTQGKVEERYTNGGGTYIKTVTTYSDQCEMHAAYNRDGSLESKTLITYDYQGKAEEGYKGDGSSAYKEFSTFDDKGNTIQVIRYGADGDLIYKKVFDYNNKGNKTREAFYDDKGSLRNETRMKYDEMGNEIENVYYSGASIVSQYYYSYEYDEKQNWTKRIEGKKVSKFGKTYLEPTEIVICEITYY